MVFLFLSPFLIFRRGDRRGAFEKFAKHSRSAREGFPSHCRTGKPDTIEFPRSAVLGRGRRVRRCERTAAGAPSNSTPSDETDLNRLVDKRKNVSTKSVGFQSRPCLLFQTGRWLYGRARGRRQQCIPLRFQQPSVSAGPVINIIFHGKEKKTLTVFKPPVTDFNGIHTGRTIMIL